MRNWPLSRLRIDAGDGVELVWATDALLDELVDVAAAGVHEPDVMPFAVAWTRTPAEDFGRRFLDFHWRRRVHIAPDDWALDLAVVVDGTPAGFQELTARDFAVRRTVATGSWLGRAFQGRGVGIRMRRAVLSLAFDHLGAVRAESGFFPPNPASEAVSRRLGYVDDGENIWATDGERHVERRVALDVDTWRSAGHDPVSIHGLDEEVRRLLGVTDV